MSADIVQSETRSGGRYRLNTEHGDAELHYTVIDGAMVIDRTYVPPKARGRGVALQLVERAVDDARKAGRKVVPECSYAAAVFGRRPEWKPLRA